MAAPTDDLFSTEVITRLQNYVYRLIDPRNGETFYVGKGVGNRVYSHIRAEPDLEGDALDNKTKRIREIVLAGFEVAHVIHRHGMDQKTALEVESALIDAYPGLTNIVAGTGASEYGAMHAQEIITRYSAKPVVFRLKAVLITVHKSATEKSLYNATRFAWIINKTRADQCEYVFATIQGVIRGVFIADQWLEATPENFPDLTDEVLPGRLGFVGEQAPLKIQQRYVGRPIPIKYRRRGAANPIKYTWPA